jgi:phage major head subunit gpT-like protein
MVTLVVIGALLLLATRVFAVINTGLTTPGIRAEFMERYDNTPADYIDLATRVPSTTQTESYRWLGSVPQLREWGTGRLAQGLRSERYDVSNGEYEATIEVDRKEIEDDQIGGIRIRVQELAVAAKTHPDFLIEQLLINGASVGYNGYDGVPFFDANHVSGESGAQSNLVEQTAVDEDVPTTVEFRASLCKAIARMVAFKDDVGLPRRVRPTGLVVVVPPSMLFTALEAIDLQLVGQTMNPLGKNVLQNVARVVSLPGLTTASRYYLLKCDVPVRPFIFQDRIPLEFAGIDKPADENVFTKNTYLYGVRARYAMAYAYWWLATQVDFAES